MELATSWISEFEREDSLYKDFYKDSVESIRLYFLYTNRLNELFHVKKETYLISEGCLSKPQLIALIKKHRRHDGKKFVPLSILKHNIDLDPCDIHDFITTPEHYPFLRAETSIQDIVWKDTITLLHPLNSLYVVFKEKWNISRGSTRKIYIRSKKLKHRKTKKKRLKASNN